MFYYKEFHAWLSIVKGQIILIHAHNSEFRNHLIKCSLSVEKFKNVGLKLFEVFFHDYVAVGAIVIRVHSCDNFLKYLIVSHFFVIDSMAVTSVSVTSVAVTSVAMTSVTMAVALSFPMPMSVAMRLLVLLIISFLSMRMTV